MILRLACSLMLLLVLALVQPAQAAGFDCVKAQTPVEKAICADPELNRLDGEMAEKYRAVQAQLTGFDRQDMVRGHLYYLEQRTKECALKAREDVPVSWRPGCLRGATRDIIDHLQIWVEMGRTIVAENNPTTRQLCSALLAKRNIVWVSRYKGSDKYELDVGPVTVGGQVLHAADVTAADFDFLNTGHPNSVAEVNVQFRTWQLQWFVAIAPDDGDGIFDRIREANESYDGSVFDKLAGDLQHMPVGQYGVFPTGNPSATKTGKNPIFKSYLVDPSNTEIFGGWYTESSLWTLGKTTYVLSQSLNNRGGPSFALFRPNPSGGLDLLCYHRAPSSHLRANVHYIGTKDICPAGHKEVPVGWSPPNTVDADAIVFLHDWGGARPLSKSQLGLLIGQVGAPIAKESDLWLPYVGIKRPAFDTGYNDFILTDKGGFVVTGDPETSSPDHNMPEPASRTYYHVENGELVPVCVAIDEVVPPVGYRMKNLKAD